jgi:hypothetical protein
MRFFFLCLLTALAWPAQANAVEAVHVLDAGSVCAVDVDAVASTNWANLGSDDLYNQAAADGTACPASLKIVAVMVVNTGSNGARIALASREAGDAATNAILIPAGGYRFISLRGLRAEGVGGTTTISYKKGGAADALHIQVWAEP